MLVQAETAVARLDGNRLRRGEVLRLREEAPLGLDLDGDDLVAVEAARQVVHELCRARIVDALGERLALGAALGGTHQLRGGDDGARPLPVDIGGRRRGKEVGGDKLGQQLGGPRVPQRDVRGRALGLDETHRTPLQSAVGAAVAEHHMRAALAEVHPIRR